MNLVISGSRRWNDYHAFETLVIDFVNLGSVHMIYAGDATGVDAMADKLARKFEIDFCRLHAKWTRDGKKAGPLRNARLSALAQNGKAIAFADDDSRGTRDFIKRARASFGEENLRVWELGLLEG